MQAYIQNDEGKIIATYSGSQLFVFPGVDRAAVAFFLFQLLMEAMPTKTPQVTWGTAWSPRNVGT